MNNQDGRCDCDHAYEYTPSFFSMQTARFTLVALFAIVGVFACAVNAPLLAGVAGFIAGHISRAYICDKHHSISV